jgi:hypothetical protein
VSEDRIPRRIFGPKRDEVMGEWRKLHNQELHNLYTFPNIIRHVKENELGRACGMHGRGDEGYKVLVESPNERDHSEDQGVYGRMGIE